jgi:hypothetical protein
MKTAGEILSVLFDEQFVNKAKSCSALFDSWKDITAKNGIAAAADHTRIKDLDKGILIIEADHPGWKQILQTKQSGLLNDLRARIPELEIIGISLILGSGKTEEEEQPEEQTPPETGGQGAVIEEPALKGLDAIDDEEFKEKIRSLGQSIAERDKSCGRKSSKKV